MERIKLDFGNLHDEYFDAFLRSGGKFPRVETKDGHVLFYRR